MKIFVWILRIVVFFLLFGLALKNDTLVTLRFYLDSAWQVPLVVVILLMFALGVFVGVLAMSSRIALQNREMSRLRKLRGAQKQGIQTRLREAERADNSELGMG